MALLAPPWVSRELEEGPLKSSPRYMDDDSTLFHVNGTASKLMPLRSFQSCFSSLGVSTLGASMAWAASLKMAARFMPEEAERRLASRV